MADKLSVLRFAWWNTGIAPPWIESRASPEHRENAKRIVERLIVGDGCAFVGLGEVRREPLLAWVPAHLRADWAELRDLSGVRNDFDVGLLYDRARLELVDHIWVRTPWVESAVRAGLLAILRTTNVATPATIAVVLAHWRANMGDIDDAVARRSRAAQALRTAIARRIDNINPEPHVLVLGDLNTEPFNTELCADLPTSRSRDVVRDHSRGAGTDDLLLYNPCWRLLGERHPWTGDMVQSLAGTYTMKKNSPSTWRTFDQVLVSSSLLNTHGWVLREDELRIGTDDEVFDRVSVNFLPPSIDHFPVLGQLQWIEKADGAR